MKTLIGTLVGALILFFWQFFSWSGPVHKSEMMPTDAQDEILRFLDGKLDEGSYFLPQPLGEPSSDEMKEFQAEMTGKPWALISYRNDYQVNMGLNMLRGFVINLVSVWLIIWILGRFRENDLVTSLVTCLSVGTIAFLTIPYLNHVWFEGGAMGYLLDAGVSWGLVGIWLGWWLNRGKS